LAAATLHRIIRGRGALAVAMLGRGENVALADDDEADHMLALGELDAAHAGGVTPMGRTSSSLKRMDLPLEANSMASRLPSVMATPTRASPSFSSTAMMPLVRGREKLSSEVFFTVPSRVAMNTNLSAE